MTPRDSASCGDILEITAYVAGVLSDDARHRFEEHCAGCDPCRRRLVEAYRIGQATPEDLEPAAPEPVRLDRAWRRVEQALAQWHGTTPGADEREADRPQPALSVARVIRLRPRIRRPPRTSSCALAAATEQAPPLSAITLAADGEEIIGKLGRHENTGDLLLYLIAEELSTLAGSRVAAQDEETGGLAEGIPDDYGVVPLPDTAAWNPTKMLVEIHLPG